MTRKKVEKVVEKESVVIFKATSKLSQKEFEELSNRIRYENKKSGVKVVLMPYSAELVEGE